MEDTLLPPVSHAERASATGGRATYLRAAADVLGRLAMVTSSPTDMAAVLDGLAELALDATGADRVSFFLLDGESERIRLWGVRGAPNAELWELGVSMESIEVRSVPGLRQLLDENLTLAIEDASASPLIPDNWVEAFGLASLIVAPLRLGDDALGLLVVDFHETRRLLEDDVKLVGTLARLSALAVSNALLTTGYAEQASRLETLVEATRALGSPRALAAVAHDMAGLIGHVLEAPSLAIFLLDDKAGYRVLAQRGTSVPDTGALAELPRRIAVKVRSAWRRGGPRPVALGPAHSAAEWSALGPGLKSLLVLPLTTVAKDVFGFIVVGSHRPDAPTPATLSLAGALAAQVAFAVERAQLDERVGLAAEFACTLLSLDDLGSGHGGLLAALHEVVPPAIGFEVTGIRLVAGLRDRGAAAPPDDPEERRLWAAWRGRRTRPQLREQDGLVYAPIWTDGRLLGLLRARPLRGAMAGHERELLEALAAGIAERLAKSVREKDADRQARELAVGEERSQVAAELHATVGRLLAAIARCAEDLQERLPTGPLAQEADRLGRLAWEGRVGLQETAASLEAYAYHPSGLPATLQHIIERLAGVLDVAADLDVRGEVRPLRLEVEQALVRTMHEALARVESRGRASVVAVRLEYLPQSVSLVVRDDGVSLAAREDGAVVPSAHFGLRVIQRRLTELGGTLTVERKLPRGLLLRATVPA